MNIGIKCYEIMTPIGNQINKLLDMRNSKRRYNKNVLYFYYKSN